MDHAGSDQGFYGLVFYVRLGHRSLGLLSSPERESQAVGAFRIIAGFFLPVFFGSSFELRYGFILEPHWLFFPSLGMFVILSQYLLQLKRVISKKDLFSFYSIHNDTFDII